MRETLILVALAWIASCLFHHFGIAPDWWHALLLGFVVIHTFKR